MQKVKNYWTQKILFSLFSFLVIIFLSTPQIASADSSYSDSDGDGIPNWVESAVSSHCRNPGGEYTIYALWMDPYYLTPPYGASTDRYRMRGVARVCSSAPYSSAGDVRIVIDSLSSRFNVGTGALFRFGTVQRGQWSNVMTTARDFNLSGLSSNVCYYTFNVRYRGRANYNGSTDWSGTATAPLYVCTPPRPTNTPTPTPTRTPTPTPTNTPTPTPIPTYTITGNVFNDTNKNRQKDSGESNYLGGISITTNRQGTITTNPDGSYLISNAQPGGHTISYTALPAGYQMVYPVNGPPPALFGVVGPGCSVDGTTGASCSGNNIINLNFAITNSTPWIQSYGLDNRFDNGYTSSIPAAPTCSPYASIQSADTTTPGIIFSGDASSSFGEGQASTTNWVAGGLNYPEVFSPASVSPTSYNSLLNKALRTGETVTDLPCTLANCTLPGDVPAGVYRANGDVTLNTYTFNANRQYVFLINGSLTITGPIEVQNGSVVFSASDTITIDRSVGAIANVCPIPDGQIQGLYSADNSIIVDGENDCTVGADAMLNVEGALVVNADGSGGSFINNRDLCGDNLDTPSFTITERIDLLLNAPPLLLKQKVIFHEDAP